jgi:hypothetical protein
VIIAPAGPKEVLRLTALGYGLSPREQEVVDLAVRGWRLDQNVSDP